MEHLYSTCLYCLSPFPFHLFPFLFPSLFPLPPFLSPSLCPILKLSQGTLVIVYPSLVKRCKNHFHNLCGASIILGNNGYVWISIIVSSENQQEALRFQVPSTPGSSSVETQSRVNQMKTSPFVTVWTFMITCPFQLRHGAEWNFLFVTEIK